MANPGNGEVAFEAGDKRYTFVLGTYAQAALQRKTGVPTSKFFNRPPDEWGASDLLALFHAGLLRHQNDITEVEAADLMDTLGRDKVQDILKEALSLAFPDTEAKGSARPPKAKPA